MEGYKRVEDDAFELYDLERDAGERHNLASTKPEKFDELAAHACNMGAWNGAVCVASRAMLNSWAFVIRAEEVVKTQKQWSEMMSDAGVQ
ncbi:hypothetical protein [Pontiella desulfatans]|uniref:hypothetical protein n=1 Tax=Pontiella desulfatans TaxID=2750659 RepID=UPI00109C72A1|nr:hypothetical protein [Pontiella desulfatans]